MNFYNEFDPKAAAWLRELIAHNIIAPGIVDERSIIEIKPHELKGFTQCHFFAGIGGWSLALRWAGWPDNEPAWTGSCPCQPLSSAGQRKGHADERHLWPAFHALIAECLPPVIFGEQVASKDGREWLAGVRADLEGSGYAVGAADLCAAGVGAPHRRQRLFWVADADGGRQQQREQGQRTVPIADTSGATDGLADVQREGLEGHAGHERDRHQPGRKRAEAAGSTAAHGEPRSVAHPEHDGRRTDEPRRGQEGRETDGRAGAVGDAAGGGLGERGDATQPGRGGHVERAGWARFETVHCRDGKTRRFEPGSFPLAHGVSGRVGLLRGYGNAIVPQVAAEFVASFLETKQTP